VVLGPYTVAPQGLNWTVQITLTFGEPGPPFAPDFLPTRAAGRGRAWYRGDCHLHTVYSDRRRLPSEVAAGARAAKLDFIVSTDHNTSSSHAGAGPVSASGSRSPTTRRSLRSWRSAACRTAPCC
jgi:hypothetical protein